MDQGIELPKPKDTKVENLAEKAKMSLRNTIRARDTRYYSFPRGHKERGDTPFGSSRDALEDICWATREDNVAEFLVESGQKVPITDKVFVTVARAPSARKITDTQGLKTDDLKDPRTIAIELNFQDITGRSPDLIQYASYSPNGGNHAVSRADMDGTTRRFDTLLMNHGEEATLKQLRELTRNTVREKFIAAMRVEKPLPQKV